MQSAGVTLVKGDLMGIARARALSRPTMRNIRQNLRWLDGRIDRAGIPLGPPPVIKPGRKATACKWYARQESAEFTRLVARACDPLTPLRDRFQA